MPTETDRVFRFGSFRLDPRQRLFLRDGKPILLPAKSLDILVLLVSRQGALVSKEEIMATVWPEVAVEESNLTHHISVVRRVLGNEHRHYLVTVSGYGYRFAPPVESPSVGSAPVESTPPPPQPPTPFLGKQSRGRFKPWWRAGAGLLLVAGLGAGIFQRANQPWRQLTFNRADDVRPAVSPDGRRVAFSSNRGGHPDIWTMSPDGSDLRNLTHGSGENDAPVFSPDGRRIAFQSRRGSSASTYIYVMNADGTGARQASRSPATRPTWSPDGKSLAYNTWSPHAAILVLDLATGTERVVTRENCCFDASWSPDGQTILHTRLTPAGLQLFVMDPRGENLQQLTSLYGRDASVGKWSPDGNRIAFSSHTDGESGVFLLRRDGTEVTRITRGFTDAGDHSWSPDGALMYFNSDRSGNPDIYSIRLPHDTGERLTEDIGEDTTPALSPHGEEVAFASNREGSFHIFVQAVATGRVEDLTRGRWEDRDPTWSPDGREIAFVSNRDGKPAVFAVRRKDRSVRRISNDAESWRCPAWSPDGTMLAAVAGPFDQGRLKLLPLNGGTPVDLAADYSSVEYPSWSPDGKTLAFSSRRPGSSRTIHTVPAGGGEVRAITGVNVDANHPTWRRDGALAYNCNCGYGTQIMLVEPGQSPRPLTSTLPRNLFPSFSKDGSRLVFVSDRDGNYELYQIYN